MILCIGEILVDMIGKEENGITSFERHPGGAPFNVCMGIKRLGGKVGFVGAVGDDLMGHFLKDYVDSLKLDYSEIYLDEKHNTTLAFVANNAEGERSFCFNRKNTADYQIPKEGLYKISGANIVHLGSLMLSEAEGIKFADLVVKVAKENNKLLSFDVNYRDDIYESENKAIEVSLKYLRQADIIKLSEDEIVLLSKEDDIDLGVKKITNENQLVFVTLGKNGSRFYFKGMSETVPTIKIKAVDTTGAGDAFYASVLKDLDGVDLNKIKKEALVNILTNANICGAKACMKKGA